MSVARDWEGSDYSRLYHSIIRDTKFATVYPDDRALATYVRLLMLADMTYPSPPPVPAGVNRTGLRVLVDAGVLSVAGGHYTIPALAKERGSRFGSGKGRPRYPSDDKSKSEPRRSEVGDESESSRNHSESTSEPRARGRASGSVYTSDSTSDEDGVAQVPDPLAPVEDWMAARRLAIAPASKMGLELARLVDRLGADRIISAAEQATDDAERAEEPLIDGRQLVARISQIVAPLYARGAAVAPKGLGPKREERAHAFDS